MTNLNHKLLDSNKNPLTAESKEMAISPKISQVLENDQQMVSKKLITQRWIESQTDCAD